jgi:Spy/CpxP family protein refolding chaperone
MFSGVAALILASSVVCAQPPEEEGQGPEDRPARSAGPDGRKPDGRPRGAAKQAPAKTGVVAEFLKSPDGDTDGLRLDDGTEVRFPPGAGKKLSGVVSLKDRVTITGWTESGESVVHAARIKNGASGEVVVVDRPPPEVSQDGDRPLRHGPEEEGDDRPPLPRPDEEGPGPRAKPKPREGRSPQQGQRQQYSLEQATSDQAQLHTIAFDGLAFLTGSFGCDTFLPPGKVSDYFGFQYMRDIDAREGGHNTSFLTRIACNMLAILDDNQNAQLVALGKQQEKDILRFAALRFPLIKAFRRNLEGDLPEGSKGLDKRAVMNYSADLYELDGLLAYQRAKVMGDILHNLNARQKAALARLKFGDSRTWPDSPETLDRRSMSHTVHVAVMTYASEMFAWQGGTLEADVYFCPERHAMYFGGFGMKTAPAMGKKDYSISTSLTGDSGEAFLAALSNSQRQLITYLVELQRNDLTEIVKTRRAIAAELRRFQQGASADKEKVLSLSRRYGEWDGEISYFYAKAFAKVGQTLTAAQKQALGRLRTTNPSDPKGPFLYSSPIQMPTVRSTDFLFAPRPFG